MVYNLAPLAMSLLLRPFVDIKSVDARDIPRARHDDLPSSKVSLTPIYLRGFCSEAVLGHGQGPTLKLV